MLIILLIQAENSSRHVAAATIHLLLLLLPLLGREHSGAAAVPFLLLQVRATLVDLFQAAAPHQLLPLPLLPVHFCPTCRRCWLMTLVLLLLLLLTSIGHERPSRHMMAAATAVAAAAAAAIAGVRRSLVGLGLAILRGPQSSADPCQLAVYVCC